MERLFIIAFLAIALTGCIRKENTNWTNHSVVPVAYGSLGIDALVPDSLIEIDENNLVHLVIRENLSDFDLDSLVVIPDTTVHRSFQSPLPGGPFILPPGTTVIDTQEDFILENETAELREIIVKSGYVTYEVKNFINGQIVVDYEFPGVTQDGDEFNIQVTALPGSVGNPDVQSGELPLDGYHFDMTGITGFDPNRLATSILVRVDPDATEDAEVFGEDSISIDISFHDAVVSYARGYFGQHQNLVQDTIDLGLTDNITADGLGIGTMTFDLHIDNYTGIDGQIKINQISSLNGNNQTQVNLENASLGETINLTRAEDMSGYVVPTQYELNMDESNSNITEFIENLPTQLVMDMDVNINPLGDVSYGNDFIYTDQALNAFAEIDIPLCIQLSNLTLSDTLSINVDNTIDGEGKLLIYADNYFPFDASLNLAVYSESGEMLGVIVDGAMLSSGVYDYNDYSTQAGLSVLEAQLTSDIIDLLVPENHLQLDVVFNSYESEEVKITSDHRLDIRVVADVELEIGYD